MGRGEIVSVALIILLLLAIFVLQQQFSSFCLHLEGGICISVLSEERLTFKANECLHIFSQERHKGENPSNTSLASF